MLHQFEGIYGQQREANRARSRAGKQMNVQHRTLNIEVLAFCPKLKLGNTEYDRLIAHFEIGCWTLDVRCSFFGIYGYGRQSV